MTKSNKKPAFALKSAHKLKELVSEDLSKVIGGHLPVPKLPDVGGDGD